MATKLKLAGRRFGRLAVIHQTESRSGQWFWMCRCDCGTMKEVAAHDLSTGHTNSCGCLKIDTIREIRTTHGYRSENFSNPFEYAAWRDMKARCLNPQNKSFKNYGARGVKICEHWLKSFDNFLADIGKRPSKYHSLDRINNDGNYEPSNCRWATTEQQQNNRANTPKIKIWNEEKTIAQWARFAGINDGMIRYRIKRGWSPCLAISKKSQRSELAKNRRSGLGA
jgi:hypothetical protein